MSGLKSTTNECLTRNWSDDKPEHNTKEELHQFYKDATEYDQFRYRLENMPFHNMVHILIGGDMGTGRSANDPIFYTHHGNVDKIWGDWQKQSPDHRDSFDGQFGLRNHIMPGLSTATAAEMLDLDNLVYTPYVGAKQNISVEYVDFDTSSMWGEGNTLSIDLNNSSLR